MARIVSQRGRARARGKPTTLSVDRSRMGQGLVSREIRPSLTRSASKRSTIRSLRDELRKQWLDLVADEIGRYPEQR